MRTVRNLVRLLVALGVAVAAFGLAAEAGAFRASSTDPLHQVAPVGDGHYAWGRKV
jgi:hypothetical protein